MEIIILAILTVYGASNIIVYSKLFEPMRRILDKVPLINKLIKCMMCISFHIGWAFSITFLSITHTFLSKSSGTITGVVWIDFAFYVIADGLLFSGTTWLIHTVQEFFEFYGTKEN